MAAERTNGWLVLSAISATVLFSVAGCAERQDPEATADERVVIEGSQTFPASSESDWVSYPSELAVVTVTAERELPPEGVLAEMGYGYLGRVVSMRVDSVLWREQRERAVPPEFEIITWGWIIGQNGERREAMPAAAPRLEVGSRYAIPLTYAYDRIGPLSDHSVAPLDENDVIRLVPGQKDDVLQKYDQKSVSALQSAIRAAAPDPRAERRRDLPPAQRARVVIQERYDAEQRAGS